MLILLPPSEGKREPEDGKAFSLAALSFSDSLTDIRAPLIPTHAIGNRADCAHQIYSGVLYQALDWSSLTRKSQIRANKVLLIFSGMYGILRMSDVILPYKAKVKTSLWRAAIEKCLNPVEKSLIVDCRSSTYSAMWQPDFRITVMVRVFQIKNGRKSVITHMSKKYRGEVARWILESPVLPETFEDLQKLISQKFEFEFHPHSYSSPAYLDLLIRVS
jgi:cytoplasmic iron level regulating protein YaaA (DUF328/UPF0246 family)